MNLIENSRSFFEWCRWKASVATNGNEARFWGRKFFRQQGSSFQFNVILNEFKSEKTVFSDETLECLSGSGVVKAQRKSAKLIGSFKNSMNITISILADGESVRPQWVSRCRTDRSWPCRLVYYPTGQYDWDLTIIMSEADIYELRHTVIESPTVTMDFDIYLNDIFESKSHMFGRFAHVDRGYLLPVRNWAEERPEAFGWLAQINILQGQVLSTLR